MDSAWVTSLIIFGFLAVALGGTIAVLCYRPGSSRSSAATLAGRDRAVFLFDDNELVDATPIGHALLRSAGVSLPDRQNVAALLKPVFPDLDDWIGIATGHGRHRARARGAGDSVVSGLQEVEVEYLDARLRLTLIEKEEATGPHPLTVSAMEDELRVLRQFSQNTQELCWKEGSDGAITWANAAYLALADSGSAAPGESEIPAPLPTWPPKAIFRALTAETHLAPAGQAEIHGDKLHHEAESARLNRRLSVNDDEEEGLWFDVHSIACPTGSIHFARDATALVKMERQSTLFMQTLTKTFAQLDIGLAIFDKNNRLVTFNPALLDLTGLPVTSLSAQPHLGTFLDELREADILPEPRNYTSWKQGVTALVTAANEGTYCETWTLPDSRIYRVSGRPHPDGAIALLFEDISNEVSLTRAFRAQVETSQAILDTLDDAIAGFSAAGTLTTSNAAFEEEWSPVPATGALEQITLSQAIRFWQQRTAPTPLWDRLYVAAASTTARTQVRGDLRLKDGRRVVCQFDPIVGGGGMFRFITHAANSGGRSAEARDNEIERQAATR